MKLFFTYCCFAVFVLITFGENTYQVPSAAFALPTPVTTESSSALSTTKLLEPYTRKSIYNAYILLLGMRGSGKSSTLNFLFGKRSIAPVGSQFDSPTNSIIQYVVEDTENLDTAKLYIIDTPGLGPPNTLEENVATLANLDRYLQNHPELSHVTPNAILIFSRFDDIRIHSESSSFVNMLKSYKQISTPLLSSEHNSSNVIFVLTRFLSETKSLTKEPAPRIAEFQFTIKMFAPMYSTFYFDLVENEVAEHELDVDSEGNYKLPNTELYPKNIIDRILQLCNAAGDFFGAHILKSVFTHRKTILIKPKTPSDPHIMSRPRFNWNPMPSTTPAYNWNVVSSAYAPTTSRYKWNTDSMPYSSTTSRYKWNIDPISYASTTSRYKWNTNPISYDLPTSRYKWNTDPMSYSSTTSRYKWNSNPITYGSTTSRYKWYIDPLNSTSYVSTTPRYNWNITASLFDSAPTRSNSNSRLSTYVVTTPRENWNTTPMHNPSTTSRHIWNPMSTSHVFTKAEFNWNRMPRFNWSTPWYHLNRSPKYNWQNIMPRYYWNASRQHNLSTRPPSYDSTTSTSNLNKTPVSYDTKPSTSNLNTTPYSYDSTTSALNLNTMSSSYNIEPSMTNMKTTSTTNDSTTLTSNSIKTPYSYDSTTSASNLSPTLSSYDSTTSTYNLSTTQLLDGSTTASSLELVGQSFFPNTRTRMSSVKPYNQTGFGYDVTTDQLIWSTPYNSTMHSSCMYLPPDQPNSSIPMLVYKVFPNLMEYKKYRLTQIGANPALPLTNSTWNRLPGHMGPRDSHSIVIQYRIFKHEFKEDCMDYNTDFLDLIQKLPVYKQESCYAVSKWRELFYFYGTHVVNKTYIGGSIIVYPHGDFLELLRYYEDMEPPMEHHEWIDVFNNIDWADMEYNSTVKVHGGNSSILKSTSDFTNTKLNMWVQSLYTTGYSLKSELQIVPIGALSGLHQLNPSALTSFNTALLEYVNGNMGLICNIQPHNQCQIYRVSADRETILYHDTCFQKVDSSCQLSSSSKFNERFHFCEANSNCVNHLIGSSKCECDIGFRRVLTNGNYKCLSSLAPF